MAEETQVTETTPPAEEKKSGMGASGFIGGIGGGAGLGYLVDRDQKNKFINKVLDTKKTSELTEKIAKVDGADTVKLAKELEELQKTRTEGRKSIDALLKKPEADKIIKAGNYAEVSGKQGLKAILDNGAEEVIFEKTGKNINAKIIPDPGHFVFIANKAEAEARGLHDIKLEGEKVVSGHYKVEGVTLPKDVKLGTPLKGDVIKNLVAETAEKDAKSWLTTAEETIGKSAGELEAKTAKKVAGVGFGFGKAGTSGKLLIGASVVAGGYVGAKVIHAIFGGKHTNNVEAQTQAEAAPAR